MASKIMWLLYKNFSERKIRKKARVERLEVDPYVDQGLVDRSMVRL